MGRLQAASLASSAAALALLLLGSPLPASGPGAADPVVSFSSGGQVQPESAGSFAITVVLDQLAGIDVQVPFTLDGTATPGSDYTVSASPLLIPAGQLQADLTVTLIDDPDPEIVETILVELGPPSLGTLGTQQRHLATRGGPRKPR